MFLKKNKCYEIEEFDKLGVKGLYTTLELIEDTRVLKADLKARKKFKKHLKVEDKTMVFASQTHSTNIAVIRDKVEDLYLETDGFVTDRKDLILFTQYADCLPVYVYDPKNQVIGICHAGWKGAFNGIQENLIKTMEKEYNSKVSDLIVGLGIGITTDNYEVGVEFFEKYYKKYGKRITNGVFSIKNNNYHYDNIKFNEILLTNLGIKKGNVICSSICTYTGEFNSYRRDKERSGRNAGVIYFK